MDKNTKKKESKAHINAILEKYNLKAPKKTQIQDKKQDYQIKPKTNDQIITVVKDKANTKTQPTELPPQEPKQPPAQPPHTPPTQPKKTISINPDPPLQKN